MQGKPFKRCPSGRYTTDNSSHPKEDYEDSLKGLDNCCKFQRSKDDTEKQGLDPDMHSGFCDMWGPLNKEDKEENTGSLWNMGSWLSDEDTDEEKVENKGWRCRFVQKGEE